MAFDDAGVDLEWGQCVQCTEKESFTNKAAMISAKCHTCGARGQFVPCDRPDTNEAEG